MSGSNLTYTPLTDGPVHTAADHNTFMAAVAAKLNGGIGTANLIPKGLDESVFADAINMVLRARESQSAFVASGLTVSTSVSLTTAIVSGVAYVNGKRVVLSGTPVTVAASKDTYLDLKDDGTVTPVPVANAAMSGMTLTTNSDGSKALRITKLVSSGTAITSSLQQGLDPLGNVIYPMSPQLSSGLVPLVRSVNVSGNTNSPSDVPLTGNITMALPAGTYVVRVTGFGKMYDNTVNGTVALSVFKNGAACVTPDGVTVPELLYTPGTGDNDLPTPWVANFVTTAQNGDVFAPYCRTNSSSFGGFQSTSHMTVEVIGRIA